MLHKSNSIAAAVANRSGAMEADTISKHGRSSKSQMSRILAPMLLFFICSVLIVKGQIIEKVEIECTSISPITDPNFDYKRLKEYTNLQNFERTLGEHGCFEKRLTSFDFLPESTQRKLKLGKGDWHSSYQDIPRLSVGIWFNYKDKLILFRTDRKNYNAIIIPFEKIRKVEILNNNYTVFRETLLGNLSGDQRIKSLHIRIVTGDINRGTQSYVLELLPYVLGYWDPKKLETQAYLTCAVRIVDEIDNIMNPLR